MAPARAGCAAMMWPQPRRFIMYIAAAALLLLLSPVTATSTIPSPPPSLSSSAWRSFNAGWRFFRGSSPGDFRPPEPPAAGGGAGGSCGLTTNLSQVQCGGLRRDAGASTSAAACAAACCAAAGRCIVWQFCAAGTVCAAAPNNDQGCWWGSTITCRLDNDTGWVGAGRNGSSPPLTPVPPARCRTPFCQADFDDSGWRKINVPHDYSSEDLPPRETDALVAPVLDVRGGAGWLFRPGNNTSGEMPRLNDSAWARVSTPHDWRAPSLSSHYANLTSGWYRKHLHNVSAAVMGVRPPAIGRVALGVVCGADQTFLNGKLLGSTGWPTAENVAAGAAGATIGLNCKAYAIPRVYSIPVGLLRNDGRDVISVHVFAPVQRKGGLCDFQFYGPDGKMVSISDLRSGPFGSGLAFNSVKQYTSDTADHAALGWTVNDSPRSQGYTAQGLGWYRKTFVMDSSNLTECVTKLLFDGIYGVADTWINGHHLGQHPYGYTAFSYNLTAHLILGPNVLAVRVSNLGATSRWYSGSGIFRRVSLAIKPSIVHIETFGVEVTTPVVEMEPPTTAGQRSTSADCTIVVAVTLSRAAFWHGNVSVTIRDATNAGSDTIASGTIDLSLHATESIATIRMQNVAVLLWSPDTPQLYGASVVTSSGDSELVTFGVKVFTSSGSGLMLNGSPIKLRGGCLHHDNGPLGAMAIGRADERRLQRIKSVGYNAVRTSHNPPSTSFLDAADRVGILIIDEAFDCWHLGKNANDYSVYFADWWERDIRSMVMRDMNHASVAMFSIGNEIPDGLSKQGVSEAAEIAQRIRALDPQKRPITMGFNKGWGAPAIAVLSQLDIVGNNYDCSGYSRVHQQWPHKAMITTESKPKDSFEFIVGVDNNAWVGGDMLWTGVDHIGETAIGFCAKPGSIEACWGTLPWPMHLNFAGDIDLVGGVKPQSYYRQVLWDKLVCALSVQRPGSRAVAQAWGWDDEVPSWTWPGDEGKEVHVRVYSKCPAVHVSLNGVAVATVKPSAANKFNASVSLKYTPGRLSAVCAPLLVASSDNAASEVSEGTRVSLVTAGAPTSLRLVADSLTVGATEDDLAYVVIELVDANGTLCDHPSQQRSLSFTADGAAEVFRVGSGDPVDVSSFASKHRKTWRGRALCVLRPCGTGVAQLVVSSTGLSNGTIQIHVDNN